MRQSILISLTIFIVTLLLVLVLGHGQEQDMVGGKAELIDPAVCRSLLGACGQYPCVLLRPSQGGRCVGDCAMAVAQHLRQAGVTVAFSAQPLGHRGCIGIRADLGGIREGGECLIQLLGGQSYHMGDCISDGFRYNLRLE